MFHFEALEAHLKFMARAERLRGETGRCHKVIKNKSELIPFSDIIPELRHKEERKPKRNPKQ